MQKNDFGDILLKSDLQRYLTVDISMHLTTKQISLKAVSLCMVEETVTVTSTQLISTANKHLFATRLTQLLLSNIQPQHMVIHYWSYANTAARCRNTYSHKSSAPVQKAKLHSSATVSFCSTSFCCFARASVSKTKGYWEMLIYAK